MGRAGLTTASRGPFTSGASPTGTRSLKPNVRLGIWPTEASLLSFEVRQTGNFEKPGVDMMRNLTLVLGVFLFVLSGRSNASPVELNLSASIASGEYTAPTVRDRAALQFQLTAPAFTVNDGDNVRVNLIFENGTSFHLLFDPLESVVGTQGGLTLADSNTPLYVVEFGFSFAFLDTDGNPILSASGPRTRRSGGDLRGAVSNPMVADLNVGGLSFEFSDIRNAGIGGLPVTFGGALFLVHNASFGEPFNQGPPATTVSEPTSGTLLAISLLGLVAWRRYLLRRTEEA